MKIFETERLILREVIESDDAFILDLLNQPSFIKYIGDRNLRTAEQAREYISSRFTASYRQFGFGMYLAELKKSGEPIGICGFVKRDSLPEPDIGFAFLPEFEGKGYAFESAEATIIYGAERLNFTTILAITTQNNDRSVKLLEKLGFNFERLINLPHTPETLKLFSFNS